MNPKLYRWFDEGHARDALIGDGEFFCRCHTWGDHDTILVFGQLLDWATTNNKYPNAAKAFSEALDFLASANRTDNAFRLVLSYIIISEDSEQSLPIDMEHVCRSLAELARRQAPALSSETQLRDLVLHVAARLPRLADILDLHIKEIPDANVA